MNNIERLLNVLPAHMVACLESAEYAELFEALSEKFDFTDEQRDTAEDVIVEVFLKDTALLDLDGHIRKLFGFDAEKARTLAWDIINECAVPFPDYFPDALDALNVLGGNAADGISKNFLLHALIRIAREEIIGQAQKILAMDVEQGHIQFSRIVERHLIDYLYGTDDASKAALNDLAIHFFMNARNYTQEFLHALYENQQIIGEGAHIEREGRKYSPQTAQWIKDFISFSAGDPSTIHIAQYLTQNKNARSLGESDRDVLRQILEMYRVAKFFPQSLAHIPKEKWMIIPYTKEEESPASLPPPPPPPTDDEKPSAPPLLLDQDEPPQSQKEEKNHQGAPAASAAPLDLSDSISLPSIVSQKFAIPQLQAPSASLHALAPVAVASAAPVIAPVREEEFHDAFFLQPKDSAPLPADSTHTFAVNVAQQVTTQKEKKIFFSGKNYQELADEVLAMSGISASDPILHARLQSVVITRLRNIRTSIEIRERLADPVHRGGFGFDAHAASSIMRSANMAADLLLQGVLKIHEPAQQQQPIEKDIREIGQLVKREFAPEPKKLGRTRFMQPKADVHHEMLVQPVYMPPLPEMAALADIPMTVKKPPPSAPPPPLKQRIVPPAYGTFADLMPLSVAAPEKKKEVLRAVPPPLAPQKHLSAPPVKTKIQLTAVPGALDFFRFRKALKPIPATYVKKLSIQDVPKEPQTSPAAKVSHPQPHSFFGATDVPRVQHTGLPAFSIQEVDGVPMIIGASPTPADQAALQATREEARKIETKKKEDAQKLREDEEKKKVLAEAAQKLEQERHALEQRTKEQDVIAPRAQSDTTHVLQETSKPAETSPEKLTPQLHEESIPSTGTMPHEQQAGGSIFSGIFHIPVSVKATQQQPGKVSFSDVKTSPRLVDTVEELRIFTLKDFRRLSEDPLNAASRIYDKIQAMERESFTKKLTAIQAWRENEINMLYIQIGQEALLKGKSITSVIEELKTGGRPYLTEQEFDAVLELNERIRM